MQFNWKARFVFCLGGVLGWDAPAPGKPRIAPDTPRTYLGHGSDTFSGRRWLQAPPPGPPLTVWPRSHLTLAGTGRAGTGREGPLRTRVAVPACRGHSHVSGPLWRWVRGSVWAARVRGLWERAGAAIPQSGMLLGVSRLCARGQAATPGRCCDVPVVTCPVQEGSVKEDSRLFTPSIAAYSCREQS